MYVSPTEAASAYTLSAPSPMFRTPYGTSRLLRVRLRLCFWFFYRYFIPPLRDGSNEAVEERRTQGDACGRAGEEGKETVRGGGCLPVSGETLQESSTATQGT